MDNRDYEYLCMAFDYHKTWKKELECEGRDYAIGMRLPFYLKELGLRDVDVRMNDRVMLVNPDVQNYEQAVEDFIDIHDLNRSYHIAECENTIEYFMNRGVNREQAEEYLKKQARIAEYFRKEGEKSFLKVPGLLIAFGRKV